MVHACGAPMSSHSHFDAQDFLDNGTPGDKSTTDGWLARAIASSQPASTVAGVAMGNKVLASMRHADQSVVSVSSLDDVGLLHPLPGIDQRISAMYVNDELLGPLAEATFTSIDLLQQVPVSGQSEAYPKSTFGQQMSDLAHMLKADIGIQAVALDIHGWDSHACESQP